MKIQIWLQSGENIGHITWRRKYLYIVDGSTKQFLAWQNCEWKPLLQIHITHHSTVLYYWQLNLGQLRCIGNTLLLLHGNSGYTNAPHCYVVRALVTLFWYFTFIWRGKKKL